MFTVIKIVDAYGKIWLCNLGAFRAAQPGTAAINDKVCFLHFGESIVIDYPGTVEDFNLFLLSQLRQLSLTKP